MSQGGIAPPVPAARSGLARDALVLGARGVLRGLARAAGLGAFLAAVPLPPPDTTPRSQGEEQGSIGVVNASGRSGAYFIPAGPRSRPMPLLVLIHGTNGTGAGIIAAFRGLAQERHFAIVAPDSRRVTIAPPDPRPPGDYYTWEVGDHPGEVTPDLTHTINCIEWVRSHTGLAVDLTHVLIAGYSGGGSSAPYIGSNRPPFTHIAVLHGGVFPGGLGPRRMPVWLSTGLQDPLRPVDQVRRSASALVGLGFRPMSYRSYPGGHGLSEAEARDLIIWWLGP